MIAHKGANKALLGLILDFAYFFEERVVQRDVGPCQVFEGFRTSGVVQMFLQLPDFLMLASMEAVSKNVLFLLF